MDAEDEDVIAILDGLVGYAAADLEAVLLLAMMIYRVVFCRPASMRRPNLSPQFPPRAAGISCRPGAGHDRIHGTPGGV